MCKRTKIVEKLQFQKRGLVPTAQPEPDLSKTGARCLAYQKYEIAGHFKD